MKILKRLGTLVIVLSFQLHTQAETIVKSILTDATVYTQGAMLRHNATFVAEKGSQVIQIS